MRAGEFRLRALDQLYSGSDFVSEPSPYKYTRFSPREEERIETQIDNVENIVGDEDNPSLEGDNVQEEDPENVVT